MKIKQLLSILGVLSVLTGMVVVGAASSAAATQTKTFETGRDSMNPWFGVALSRITTPAAHAGSYSLKIASTGQYWGVEEGWPGTASVTPGTTYRVGAWLKAVSGTTSVGIDVVWINDRNGTGVREDSLLPERGSVPTAWTEYARSYVAPAGATNLLWRIYGVGRGTLQVDDMSVASGTVPPSTTATTSATTTRPTTTTQPPVTSTTTRPPTSTTTTPPTTTTTTTTTPPSGCTNPTLVLGEGEGRTFDYNPGAIYVHNDAWNWGPPDQHETMYVCDYNNWYVDSWGFDTPEGEVFMYPSTKLDVTGSCCAGRPLSDFPNQVKGRFAGTVSGYAGGSYNVAWDLWLNGVAYPCTCTEMMIWTQRAGIANPWGDRRPDYTAPNGQVYEVWWDGNVNGANGGSYLAFISKSTQTSGEIDIREFVAESARRGYMNTNPTLNQLNFGIEVRDTGSATQSAPARMTLTDYALIMN